MAELNWGLLNTNPISAQSAGFDYAEKVRNAASMRQAGQQYSTGDYSGASQTLAKSGDIANADKLRTTGLGINQAGLEYIGKFASTFDAIAQQHASDPDGGKQAIAQNFDSIAQEAQAATGISPQAIANFRANLIADPQSTLARLKAQLPIKYQSVEGTLYGVQGMQATPIAQQPKFTSQAYGTSLVPTNQAAVDAINSTPPAPQTQASPQAPVPASDGQLIPGVNPQATAQVESRNNPAAVSPAGAVGTMQTMPGTLQSPGFGVAPAANNTPQEQTRVGTDYLQAMNQKYGNPVVAHIAYNMGPGATDAWLQKGARWQDLPKETQNYLGQTALAQTRLQGGLGQPAAQNQGQPQAQGPARIGQPINGGPAPIDNEAIRNDVRIWLASKGTINPQYGMGQLGAAQRQAFDVQKNALMKELNVSPEDVASGQAIRKADTQSLSSLQKQRDTVKAFEQTASKNADLALSLLDAGGPQGQAPIINKWTQEWRKWFQGDKSVSQYTLALGTFADEYAKVVAGQNGATDTVRAEAYNRINGAMNKGTIRAVIGTMKQEMANRTTANDEGIAEIKSRLGAPQASNPQPVQQAAAAPANVIKYDAKGNRIK